jgi:acyl-coenzyme A thioesterase PaaI-like protein
MSISAPGPNQLDVKRIEELVAIRFPQIHAGGRNFVIEQVGARSARVRMKADPRNTRPGGTISGPPCSRWPISASTWR